jgi:hypothetical protein
MYLHLLDVSASAQVRFNAVRGLTGYQNIISRGPWNPLFPDSLVDSLMEMMPDVSSLITRTLFVWHKPSRNAVAVRLGYCLPYPEAYPMGAYCLEALRNCAPVSEALIDKLPLWKEIRTAQLARPSSDWTRAVTVHKFVEYMQRARDMDVTLVSTCAAEGLVRHLGRKQYETWLKVLRL